MLLSAIKLVILTTPVPSLALRYRFASSVLLEPMRDNISELWVVVVLPQRLSLIFYLASSRMEKSLPANYSISLSPHQRPSMHVLLPVNGYWVGTIQDFDLKWPHSGSKGMRLFMFYKIQANSFVTTQQLKAIKLLTELHLIFRIVPTAENPFRDDRFFTYARQFDSASG